MAPQKFADLGKEARDLTNKNYHLGAVKLEVNTKSASGLKFKTEGSHNTDTGAVAAALETKFGLPQGVAVTTKWNTDNVVSKTIGVENKLVDGLKIDLDTSLAIVSGKKSLKVKTAYTGCDLFHGTLDVDVAAAPVAHLSGVLAYEGIHFGYQGSYDFGAGKLLNNNFSAAYKAGDLVLHGGVVNASKYVGSVHHKVNDKFSVAGLVGYDADAGTSLTLSGSFAQDAHTTFKAKIDNNLGLGCAYVQTIKPGLQLTLSGLINAKALDQGGHKIGLMLNFDA